MKVLSIACAISCVEDAEDGFDGIPIDEFGRSEWTLPPTLVAEYPHSLRKHSFILAVIYTIYAGRAKAL